MPPSSRLEQSAKEHRNARYAALRRITELQRSEEASQLQELECQKDAWEFERGLKVRQLLPMM